MATSSTRAKAELDLVLSSYDTKKEDYHEEDCQTEESKQRTTRTMLSLVAAVEQSKNITTSSTSSNNNNVWKNKECEGKDENNKQDEEEEQDRQHHGNKQANSTITDFLKSELLEALNRLEREYDYYCQQKDQHHKEIHNHRKTVNSKQRNNTRNTSAAYWSSLSTPEGSTIQHPSIQVISKSREGGGVQEERMIGIITGSTNELSTSSSPGEELSSSTTTNDKGYEQRYHDIADNCDDGSQSPPQFLLKEDHKNISSPLWRQFYSDDNFEAVEVEDEEDASLEHYESSSFFLFEEDKETGGIYASTTSSDQDGGEPFPAFDLFQSAYESSREKCGQILDAVKRVNEFLDGIQYQQVKAILVGEEPVLEEERRATEGSGSHLLPEASLDESLAVTGASNNCADSRISNCSISNISSSTSHLPKNEETDVTLTRRQENGHTSNHKTSSKENKDASVEMMMDVVIEEQGKNDERRKATTVPRHPALMMIITPPNMVHPGTAERRYFDTPLSPAADDRCCLIEQGTTSSIDKLLQEIEQEAKQEEIFKKKRRIEILRKRELLLSQERVDVVTKRSAVEGFQRLSRKVMIRKLIRYKRYRRGLNTVERIERAVLLTISLSLWKHFASCKRSAKVILRCLLRYHLILARRKKREEAAMRFLQNWILLRKDTMMTKIIQKRFMKVAKYTIDAWRLRIHEEKQLEELQSAVVRRSSAVCTIQGFLRILMARRKLVFLRLQAANLSRSASRIQSLWRMSQARKNVRSLKIKYDAIKNNAATTIQKVVRGSKIRSRYIAITRRKSQFSIHDPELDAMLDEDDSIENMLFDIVSAEEDDKRHVFSDCWVPSLPIISHSCNDEDRMVGYKDANRHHGEIRHIGNVKEDYKNQVHSTSQLSNNGIRLSEEQKLMGEWNIKDQRVLEVRLK